MFVERTRPGPRGDFIYGPSADVFSFGIVLWEIAAQAIPWMDIEARTLVQFADALLQRFAAEKRPAIDPVWPAKYSNMMRRCWATKPAARDTFAATCEVFL